jgi:WD40 repeat protein
MFNPDGTTFATGSEDGTIILWDVTNPRLPRQLSTPLTGHTGGMRSVWFLAGGIRSVAFSPDGKALASGTADGAINLWDATNPRAPTRLDAPLLGHSAGIFSVAFSPDGKTLASGSADSTIFLWNIDLKSWQARACQMAGRNFTHAEWVQYFGDEAYHKTCEQWPLEPEATPAS